MMKPMKAKKLTMAKKVARQKKRATAKAPTEANCAYLEVLRQFCVLESSYVYVSVL